MDVHHSPMAPRGALDTRRDRCILPRVSVGQHHHGAAVEAVNASACSWPDPPATRAFYLADWLADMWPPPPARRRD